MGTGKGLGWRGEQQGSTCLCTLWAGVLGGRGGCQDLAMLRLAGMLPALPGRLSPTGDSASGNWAGLVFLA